MKRYEQMIKELDVLIRKSEQKHQQQAVKNSDGPPVILGGQIVNEGEFEDENMCQICCFSRMDTEFVPC